MKKNDHLTMGAPKAEARTKKETVKVDTVMNDTAMNDTAMNDTAKVDTVMPDTAMPEPFVEICFCGGLPDYLQTHLCTSIEEVHRYLTQSDELSQLSLLYGEDADFDLHRDPSATQLPYLLPSKPQWDEALARFPEQDLYVGLRIACPDWYEEDMECMRAQLTYVLDASLAFKSVNADAVYFVLRRRLPACRKPDDVMMFLVRQLSEARTRVMDFLQDDEEYITLQFDVAPYCPLCFDPHAFFWGEKTPFSKAIDDAHRRALRLLQEENDEAEAEEAKAETEAEKAEAEENEEDFEDEEEDEENFESEEDEESEEEEDEDDEAKAEKAETETDDDEEADR
jgi:hypothetical protein